MSRNVFVFGLVILLLGARSLSLAQATQVRVETRSDGSGVVVAAQNLPSGDTLRVFAVSRTALGDFVANVAATWSLDSLLGGMVAGDLVASTDGKSALLTGRLVGSGVIRARAVPDTLEAIPSGRISIVPGVATRLDISIQPSATATAGVAFATQPRVRILDAAGNIVTSDNTTTVTAARLLGTGVLQGTLTQTAVAGVATFTNLQHNVATTINIRFTATPTLTPDTSTNIVVGVGPVARLLFVSQPGNAIAGAIITPPETVRVQDAFGNNVPDSGRTVVASIQSGTGTLLGTATRTTNVSGIAVFNDLRINITGTKTLKASSAGLDSAVSASFVISAAAARKLTVRTQPSPTATAGVVFAQQPVVAIEDTFGNLVTTNNTTSVTATRNAGTGVLQGTTTLVASGGLVTFTNLRHNVSGTINIRFRATPVLDSTVSSNIIIAPAAASKLVFGQQPTNTASGAAISPPVTVQLRDTFDNNVTTAAVPILMTLSSGTGTLSGTTTQNTNAAGLATFANLSINLVGTKVLTASRSGLTSAVSNSFSITVGAPASVVASNGTPQTAQVNTAFATNFEVTVRDAAGNLASGVLVRFSKPATGASGTFAGGVDTVRTNALGVATAPVFTANTIAGSYTDTASVAGVATPALFSLTNTPGPARQIAANVGSGQSVPIGQTFPINMIATVSDTFGNRITGAVVRWTKPATGPTGTFQGGVDSAITNANGDATAAPFTAGLIAGPYAVTATTGGITTPASFFLTNLPGPPQRIIAVEGMNQSAQVRTAFGINLKARVEDIAGNPISNLLVRFTKPATSPSGTFAGGVDTARTDTAGAATAPVFTADSVAGSYNDSAFVVGTTLTGASFPLTNLSGPAGSITPTTGTTPQTTTVNTAFPVNLGVTVRDGSGNPVNNVLVTFSAPATGPSGVFPNGRTDTVRTGVNGVATARTLTANTIAGQFQVTASAQGVLTPAVFALRSTPAAAARISATAGTPQSTTVGTLFATRFKARVTDQFDNPIRDASVTFLVPTTGPRGTFEGNINTATTDSTGEATAQPFTAGTLAGSYFVRATSSGTDTANYSLTNRPGSAETITVTGGTPQTATVNTWFGDSLRAVVRDVFLNPVPGLAVTFTAPLTGASGKFQNDSTRITLLTNALGVVAVRFRADTIAGGPYVVNATVSGVSTPATFTLRNTTGPAASIAIVAGSPQDAVVNRRYAINLQARVRDAFGNNKGGVTVTFQAPTTGATGTFPSGATATITSDSITGLATAPVFTANSRAGRFNVNASVVGVTPSAVFALRNLAGTPATMQILSGSPETTRVATVFPSRFRVEVIDSFTNRVPGVTVVYTAPITGASGTFQGGVNQATTDSLGVATPPPFTANTRSGSYIVSASVAAISNPIPFLLTNAADDVFSIVATSGTPQTTRVATVFPERFRVLLQDRFSNPTPRVSVTFVPPGGGPTGYFENGVNTFLTDSSGSALADRFFANNIAGGPYDMRVVAQSVDVPRLIQLTNVPGPARSIVTIAGSPDSAIVGNSFPRIKTVLVRDSLFNGVPDVLITTDAPASGPSITGPPFPRTDAQGRSSVNWSANLFAGSYMVRATISGVAAPAVFNLTNRADVPSSIAAAIGNSQATQVGDTFRINLGAVVRDRFQNRVPNATVTFTAPTSGPTAVFEPGGASVTRTTNDSGYAFAPKLRANGTVGRYGVRASVTGVSAPDTFRLENTFGRPGTILIVDGDGQSVPVASPYPVRFRVRVLDEFNNPVQGATVTWRQPTSGPSGTFEGNQNTATTDLNGFAVSAMFTANNAVGTFQLPADAPGVVAPAVFRCRNIARGANNSQIIAGAAQRTEVITGFPVRFQVQVRDTFFNPVPGVLVTFTAPPQTGPSGTFPGGQTTFARTTDSLGLVTAETFTANRIANFCTDVYELPYTVQGITAPLQRFQLGNNPRQPSTIVPAPGTTPQTATINRQFGTIAAIVTDDLGNPRCRDTVRFAAPLTGPSGTFPGGRRDTFALTDNNGRATAPPFTANAIAGGAYNLTATRTGVSAPANFALTNAASGGSTITATSGTPQSTPVNQRFPQRLQVTVIDSSGNRVPNVVVIFNTPFVGPSASFVRGINQFVTDSSGIATTDTLRANAIAGSYIVSATIPGGTAPANFQLTNLTSGAASIRVTGGTPQTKQVNMPFDSLFSVVVRDASGNPISGATVTFTAPDTSASGTFLVNNQRSRSMSATTDSLGRASSTRLTADTVAGRYVVYASTAGVAQRDSFSLTNVHAPLSRFTIESATGGAIGTQLTLVPFTVRISARDQFNNTAMSFTDSVIVTSNGQLATGGGVTPRFTDGILSRQVSFRRAEGSDVRLTATRAAGGSETGSSNAFRIQNPSPVVNTISPDSAGLLETLWITLAGQNFIDGVTDVNFGSHIIRDSLQVDSTRIRARISIDTSASIGNRDIIVTNVQPGGGSTTVRFRIWQPLPLPPALAGPTDSARNMPTVVTLTWSRSVLASRYHLQVATDIAFTSLVVNDSTIADTRRVVGPLANGTKYYWRVRAINERGPGVFTPYKLFSTVPLYPANFTLNAVIQFPSFVRPGDYSATDYRLVGLPGDPLAAGVRLPQILNGTQDVDWVAYRDNGLAQGEIFVPYSAGDDAFRLSPGRGFWILRKGNLDIASLTVPTAAFDSTTSSVSIALTNGWNIITNPLDRNVPVAEIRSLNPSLVEAFWPFQGTFGVTASGLEPYQGYYFFNNPNASLPSLKIPFGFFGSLPKASPTKSAEGEWRISIELISNTRSDRSTVLGVARGSRNGLDSLEYRKPRALGGVPSIYFNRPEWDSQYSGFAVDLRPRLDVLESWLFQVQAKPTDELELRFDGVADVPPHLNVFLIDEQHARYSDLRAAPTYRLRLPTGSAEMKVIVGRPEAVQEVLNSVLPKEFGLGNNFPNPFNPTTTIPIALPHAADVAVRVYNILGQEVRTLQAGVLDAGRHFVFWDGKDNHGMPVASGMYITRFTTNVGKAFTGKMIMMK